MARKRTAARSAQAKDQRRRQIVDAAKALFLRKGFTAGSMNDLALQLGVAKGTLYVYFRSKSELLVAVMRGIFDELAEVWQPILSGDAPALSRLEALARAALTLCEQHLDTCALLMKLWGATGEGETFDVDLTGWLRDTYADYRQAVAAIIRSGIESGEIRCEVDPDRAASLFIATLDGLMIQWIVAPALFDLEGCVRTVRRVFLRGLQGDAG